MIIDHVYIALSFALSTCSCWQVNVQLCIYQTVPSIQLRNATTTTTTTAATTSTSVLDLKPRVKILIVIKVFVKRKILSIETILITY